jgi:hypothetical protein
LISFPDGSFTRKSRFPQGFRAAQRLSVRGDGRFDVPGEVGVDRSRRSRRHQGDAFRDLAPNRFRRAEYRHRLRVTLDDDFSPGLDSPQDRAYVVR